MTPTTPSPISDQAAGFDMLAHLARQRAWSELTFGPGARTKGVVDHIRKELTEIEADPTDLTEWIDVVILALDGAWRAGGSPEQIIATMVAKQTKNEGRAWPDWRTADPDKAIEHDRAKDTAPTTGSAPEPDDPGIAGAGDLSFEEAAELGRCKVAPIGWTCSREKGHSGPCAASPAASGPHPSIARAIAQEERACRAEDALIDLVNQIRKSNPVDDHGHDLKMNRAYLESVKLLDAVALLAASMGGDAPITTNLKE